MVLVHPAFLHSQQVLFLLTLSIICNLRCCRNGVVGVGFVGPWLRDFQALVTYRCGLHIVHCHAECMHIGMYQWISAYSDRELRESEATKSVAYCASWL